jgi:hypothetical protein
MPFSDYSQRMAQNQVDLVRRFNRVVTQRIGALDDAYLSRGRSLGLSRLLWEIEPAGSEVRLLRARLGLDSAITLPMTERHRTYTPNLSKRGATAIQCAEAQTSTLAKFAPPHTAAHKLGHQLLNLRTGTSLGR